MASNGATARLIARVNLETVIEIADDVYVVHEDEVEKVRSRLSDQPQIAYFLDRNMRADEVRINGKGDKFWVVRKPGMTPFVTTGTLRNAVLKPADVEMEKKYVGMAGGVEKRSVNRRYHNGSLQQGSEIHSKPAYTARVRRFGPYFVGDVVRPKTTWHRIGPGVDPKDFPTDYEIGGTRVTYATTEEMRPLEWDVMNEVTPPLRTNYVVIAGPAVCEYAEFFPDFAWISADYVEVAKRIEAVLVNGRAKAPDSAKLAEAEAAIAKMKGKVGHKLILVRGSPSFDPLALWPAAAALPDVDIRSIDPGELGLTPEKRDEALADWSRGEWILTAVGEKDSAGDAQTVLAGFTGAEIMVKASGVDTISIGVPGGLTSFVTRYAGQVLKDLLDGGKTLEWVDSPWLTNPLFERDVYDSLKAEIDAYVPNDPESAGAAGDYGVTDEGDNGGLGPAVVGRLLSDPMADPDEEALIIPALSPQYFWSKYARMEEVRDRPVPDMDFNPKPVTVA